MKYSADLSGDKLKNYTLQGFERYYEVPVYGFTLAEVLITLGIIGVVAALTVPALISNYQDKVQDTRYKKARNILINGYRLMLAKDQLFDVSQLAFMKDFDTEEIVASEHKKVFKVLSDSLGSLKTEKLPKEYKIENNDTPSPFDWEDVPYVLQISDGMLFGIEQNAENTKNFYVYADVNANAGPNEVKKDLYKFMLSKDAQLADVSSQLEETNVCSEDNMEACLTDEECKSLANNYEDKKPEVQSCSTAFYIHWTTGVCFKEPANFAAYCK